MRLYNNPWFFKEVWPRLSNVATLFLESVIRGHHIYRTPLLGETLNTSLELDNEHDKYMQCLL